MTDIILFLVILVLLAFLAWKEYMADKHTKELIKAVIAKNSSELANLNLSETTKLNVDTPPPLGPLNDDLVPLSNLSQDEFDQAMDKSLEIENDENAT